MWLVFVKMENVWRESGGCSGVLFLLGGRDVLGMFGAYSAVFEGCLESVWVVFEWYAGDVWVPLSARFG